ncbi:MAG: hypothetical protein ACXAC5_15485 [Promethearchaeota archaeon]|jgi:hypothetical protein
MTEVTEEEFLNKLLDVVHKLSSIAKTQSYRFKKKWDEYLKPMNNKPHIVRQIPLDKNKFLSDIDYRIKVLKNVENAVVDGFHSIKSLLETLYGIYFDSELFKKDFSEEDQLVLKYLTAKHILGNLIQYNKMDHESVPMKYNIMARNYTLIKLKGQTDTEILDNLKKLNITEIKKAELNIIMKEVKSEGIITIKKKGKKDFYELSKELELSPKGKKHYNQVLQPLVDYPTGFWRSFYNIRELNVTPDENCTHQDFLMKVLTKCATQGYGPTHYVFKNLVKYYEKLKKEN